MPRIARAQPSNAPPTTMAGTRRGLRSQKVSEEQLEQLRTPPKRTRKPKKEEEAGKKEAERDEDGRVAPGVFFEKKNHRRGRQALKLRSQARLNAEELLAHVESAKETTAEASLEDQTETPAPTPTSKPATPKPATPKSATSKPATPKTTTAAVAAKAPSPPLETPRPVTPKPTWSTWIKKLIPWTPSAPVASPPVPATAPPVTLPPEDLKEITAALTPMPTRTAMKQPRKTTTRAPNKRFIAQKTLESLNSQYLSSKTPEVRKKAEEWVKQTVKKLGKDSKLGDKRKLFEQGIKMSEVEAIPSRAPWESEGTFGLQDDFFDYDSDDEDALIPAWFALQLIANDRPFKKRKTGAAADMNVEVPSLNDLDAQASATPNRNLTTPTKSLTPTNTLGISTALSDTRPRSSVAASSMFNNPVIHREGSNIFDEHAAQTASRTPAPKSAQALPADVMDRFGSVEAFHKELRRTGHVEGVGTFCVPEGDSDEEDESITEGEEESASTPIWKQQPPPAPTPAHATLPAPITAAPSVPAIQEEDPVRAQRARIMKHTPAKPSRLREAMVPSPSLRSDAGTEAVSTPSLAASTTPLAPVFGNAAKKAVPLEVLADMPDATPLDLGDPELDAALRNRFNSDAWACWKEDASAPYDHSEVFYYSEEDPLSEEDTQ